MNYEKLLSFQMTLNPDVIYYVDAMMKGSLSPRQINNKKHYAKKTGNLNLVINLTTAYEIVNHIRRNHVEKVN